MIPTSTIFTLLVRHARASQPLLPPSFAVVCSGLGAGGPAMQGIALKYFTRYLAAKVGSKPRDQEVLVTPGNRPLSLC